MAPETKTGNASRVAGTEALFRKVVVGVDPSAESVEAARQAAILAGAEGEVVLVAVWTQPPPIIGGVGAPATYQPEGDAERAAAEDAIEAARTALSPREITAVVVCGTAWERLLHVAADEKATAVVVGSHGTGRARGILIGSTATEVVHKASCSVLVARKAGGRFPARIVVGVDGSEESAAAYAAAATLAGRLGAEARPLVARGKGVDGAAVARIVGSHEARPDEPVRALAAASAEADLLVVGSRGLRGPRALRSVSERVAHAAHCSTLIVRGASGTTR